MKMNAETGQRAKRIVYCKEGKSLRERLDGSEEQKEITRLQGALTEKTRRYLLQYGWYEIDGRWFHKDE